MKAQLLIFPVILFLTFSFVYLTLTYFNNKNELLIDKAEKIYLPSSELSIKLNSKLAEIQASLQNAVAIGEKYQIKETDTIAKEFFSISKSLEEKAEIINNQINLSNLFNTYYDNARTVSLEMINGDISEGLEIKIGRMLFQYNEIDSLLRDLEIKSKKQARDHFSTIKENNKKSAISNVLIIFTGFIISILLSYLYSKAIAKPLRALNYELQASEEELKQMNEELSKTNDLMISKNEELNNALSALKEAQSHMVQSEKMASIGLLTSGIAHEINNPLNFIHGGVTGIENYAIEKLPEHVTDISLFLNWIKEGVERASNIVTSVSHYSRKADNATEQCDIHLIIDNCLVMLLNKLKHKIKLKKEYFHKPIIVIGNQGRLHQSLLNILTNAEQAIEKNGVITIKTKIEQSKLKITITDTGCGIKKENLLQITEPFFTTKAPGKGTGLGLSITYNIIHEHKGNLKYKSELGKGTTAIIELPITTTSSSKN